MRNLVLVFLTLMSLYCKANEIDKLQTVDDVTAFLDRRSPYDSMAYFKGEKYLPGSRCNDIKFLKIDIDKDGLTDLIINGKYLLVVMDNRKGAYDFHFIDKGVAYSKKYVLMNVDQHHDQPLIVITRYDKQNLSNPKGLTYDTFIFKFGGLVEYNSHPGNLKIYKLSFTTSTCSGKCPVFALFVQSDGLTSYHAIKYNPKDGNFSGRIDKTSIRQLGELLNYLNLQRLKDDYGIPIDGQVYNLKVKYEGSSIKSIRDGYDYGTFGLGVLYDFLFRLRVNQVWYQASN